jgi:hypothetical protein
MYKLKANIQGYYENHDSIVFYTIAVTHYPSNSSWICNRKLEEFQELHKSLSFTYKNLRCAPGFTNITYLNSYLVLPIKRLSAFIDEILSISDIFACEEISKFFDVDLRVENSLALHSRLEKKYSVVFPIVFTALDQELAFIADCRSSMIHKIEKYINILGYSNSVTTVIRCITDKLNWEIRLPDIITYLEWSPHLTILAAGFEDGNVVFYRIKTEKNYAEYEEYLLKLLHAGKVLGIKMNYRNSKVYTCGADGKLSVCSLSNNNYFSDVILNFLPVQLDTSVSMELLYICSVNDLNVYDAESLEKVATIKVNGGISAFSTFDSQGFAIGTAWGSALVYSANYDLCASLYGSSKITSLKYWECYKILVTGDFNGIVSLWDAEFQKILAWRPHDTITSLNISFEKIITAGSDKAIKVWTISI